MINMPKNSQDHYERCYARNREEWHQWLENNHTTVPGVWLVHHKKGSDQSSVSYEDAVEEALRFGWIDSKVNALDEHRFMQVFTPRKPGSTWSKSNKQRVKKLIKEGMMTPAGLVKIEASKKDGSWNVLDDIEELIIPEDLQRALENNKAAQKRFEAFTDSVKKQILWWIVSARLQKPG
jgi:uncharacterized protein YdeI (YjbR/CyaY-like superfamily)